MSCDYSTLESKGIKSSSGTEGENWFNNKKNRDTCLKLWLVYILEVYLFSVFVCSVIYLSGLLSQSLIYHRLISNSLNGWGCPWMLSSHLCSWEWYLWPHDLHACTSQYAEIMGVHGLWRYWESNPGFQAC